MIIVPAELSVLDSVPRAKKPIWLGSILFSMIKSRTAFAAIVYMLSSGPSILKPEPIMLLILSQELSVQLHQSSSPTL